jgi:hypothetical protein
MVMRKRTTRSAVQMGGGRNIVKHVTDDKTVAYQSHMKHRTISILIDSALSPAVAVIIFLDNYMAEDLLLSVCETALCFKIHLP